MPVIAVDIVRRENCGGEGGEIRAPPQKEGRNKGPRRWPVE